jgi:hypothetical protein
MTKQELKDSKAEFEAQLKAKADAFVSSWLQIWQDAQLGKSIRENQLNNTK